MAEKEIDLRRLVIKAFHMTDVNGVSTIISQRMAI